MTDHKSPEACQLDNRIRIALRRLLEAWDYAEDAGHNLWNFAVEIDDLRTSCKEGLNRSDLRWMITKHLLEHRRELTSCDAANREFGQPIGLKFADHSCFVLTPKGASFARMILHGEAISSQISTQSVIEPSPVVDSASVPPADLMPTWDKDRRKLSLGCHVIKQFKVPAPNQQLVLTVFQELNWPTRIDDPLPPKSEIDCKRRLHDTITSLNRHHRAPLLSFHGDGQGEGVVWEKSR